MNTKIIFYGGKMKSMMNLMFGAILIIYLIGGVNAYSGGGGTCDCGDGATTLGGNTTDACVDCTEALNDNTNCTNQVNYVGTVAISNYGGTCINNPANFTNKIFDCQGYTIDGTGNGTGISLSGKSGNTIKNCVITNFVYGIRLDDNSVSNTITNNKVNLNDIYGISLWSSSNNSIANNTANNNNNYGILLSSSSNNNLANNTANSNGAGIGLSSSSNNALTSNTANDNYYKGIFLSSSNNNTITNNTATLNNYGIYLYDSDFNEILNNEILNNTQTGITISDCEIGGTWCPGGNTNTTLEENEISNNGIGIYSQASSSIIDSNVVCGNTNLDFSSSDWLTSSGDNNTCDTSDGWNDTGVSSGCFHSCVAAPSSGSIIITEIMMDPAVVTDTNGEYVELYNSGNKTYNLQGLILKDNGSNSHTISSSLLIAPESYIVLCKNDNSSENGGFTCDYQYSGFMLSNTPDDEVILEMQNSTVIDEVWYNSSWPFASGSSMNLDPGKFDAVLNDDPANWCESTSAFGDGDKGTPGSANDDCGLTALCYEYDAGICTVKTGENCTCINKALNDSINCYNEVRLNSSIINWTGTCVDNPVNFTNKTFDCQGNIIDGDGAGIDYGIYFSEKSGNTIKNCVITGFGDGIYISNSNNNTIINNTANNNTGNSGHNNPHGTGIYLYYSSNNNIINNTANYNDGGNNTGTNAGGNGIRLYYYSSNNNIINNTANYNSGYSSSVDHAGNGILIGSSSNNNITNNAIHNNNGSGIFLEGNTAPSHPADNNTVTNNTVTNNEQHGLYLSNNANNNNITSNIFCSNNQSEGTYFDVYHNPNNPLSTHGDNNTCDTTDNWNDTGTTGCTSTCTLPYVPTCGENHTQGLVSYWKADGDASDAYDGNDGTLMNGVTATASGKVGQAFSFDGVNDIIAVSDSPSLQITGDITIEAWVKPDNTQGGGFIPVVSKGTPGSSNGYHLFVHSDNTIYASIGLNNRWIYYNTPIPIGVWTHVVVANEGTHNKIYINRVLVEETENTGDIGTDSYELQIGGRTLGHPDGGYFNGTIDEVAIYNRALTPDEIQQHYINGLNGEPYCASYFISVIPPNITVPVNQTFSITVNISGTDIVGAGFDLIFNNTILEALNIYEGSFIGQCTTTTYNALPPEINNTEGNVSFHDMCWGGETISGTGAAAVITFKALSEGVSDLLLQNAEIFNSNGTHANPVSGVVVENGSVEVVSNLPPHAEAGPDKTVYTNQVLQFNGSNSTDADGNIISYFWDFGDTNNATGAASTHTYTSPGTYTVNLTVTDDDGAADSDTLTVTVYLAGDVNHDGCVNIYDLAKLAVAGDSATGNARFNPDADFNNDGTIDFDDLALLAANWKKCT
ncbi:hypothetical protein BEH94_04350 [Candidatus Altiarchaeales archaeon WOR_SM1_SCG]|nr:hypothetical protein BEH94_04350 [Candidatus Altiarchaeales archaeon WOR_SM1_SCG]